MSESPMPTWTPTHQIGDVLYARLEVTGYGAKGELYVRPIEPTRAPMEPVGEFKVLETWVFPGSVITDAIKRELARKRGGF